MKSILNFAVIATLNISATSVWAQEPPPIEAYGELPEIGNMALSPDGTKIAYFSRRGSDDFMLVSEIGGEIIGGANANRVKARGISFPTNDVVVASTSTTRQLFRLRYEEGESVAYNIKTKKLIPLIMKDTWPASSFGAIRSIDQDKNRAIMTGFEDNRRFSLYDVNLLNGRYKVHKGGTIRTIDWVVDKNGDVIAREDYDRDEQLYQIRMLKDGKWQSVYETKTKKKVAPFNLWGTSPDKSKFLVYQRLENQDFGHVTELSFDGKLSATPIFQANRELSGSISTYSDIIEGVSFGGETPSYELLDPNLNAVLKKLVNDLSGVSVSFIDWTADFSKLLLNISGSGISPSYFLFDSQTGSLTRIARQRPKITDAHVGDILSIKYKATDGLQIPAILSLPPNKKLGAGEKLPLVVLPHGGPASHDTLAFDWLSQAFASRGYMVFQPNFRGSTGYGESFERAGDGEWGARMQDDVTDGVNAMIRNGWVDPDRICILGASYGGYAALAGGAFTPDLYKCVVAIAPVSDLLDMLDGERSDFGRNSSVYEYWTKVIGDRRRDKEKLKSISPAFNAENFKAPVLLIHGVDDTVVPYAQSTRMQGALKRAKKPVQLVKLSNEDHWLSVGESRLQMLQESINFIDEHIGDQ